MQVDESPAPRDAEPHGPPDALLEDIVRQGPVGTWALAGAATALVVAMYLVFYVLVYLPRGAVQ